MFPSLFLEFSAVTASWPENPHWVARWMPGNGMVWTLTRMLEALSPLAALVRLAGPERLAQEGLTTCKKRASRGGMWNHPPSLCNLGTSTISRVNKIHVVAGRRDGSVIQVWQMHMICQWGGRRWRHRRSKYCRILSRDTNATSFGLHPSTMPEAVLLYLTRS